MGCACVGLLAWGGSGCNGLVFYNFFCAVVHREWRRERGEKGEGGTKRNRGVELEEGPEGAGLKWV